MIREEVVDDGIEVLGKEYFGGRIVILEIVEVSEGVTCNAGTRHWIGRGLKIFLKVLRGRFLQWG